MTILRKPGAIVKDVLGYYVNSYGAPYKKREEALEALEIWRRNYPEELRPLDQDELMARGVEILKSSNLVRLEGVVLEGISLIIPYEHRKLKGELLFTDVYSSRADNPFSDRKVVKCLRFEFKIPPTRFYHLDRAEQFVKYITQAYHAQVLINRSLGCYYAIAEEEAFL